MLDGGRHDVAARTPQGDPLDGEVVGLGRAAQEDDAVGAPPDQPAHLGAGRPEGIAGLFPQAVAGPGVADPALQKGPHDARAPGGPPGQTPSSRDRPGGSGERPRRAYRVLRTRKW